MPGSRLNRAGALLFILTLGTMTSVAQEPRPSHPRGERPGHAKAARAEVDERSDTDAPLPGPSALPRPAIEDTRCYRMQVTLFELMAPSQQLLSLDASALASRAGTAAALQAELSKAGAASVRLHADQLVSAMGPIRFTTEGDRAYVRRVSTDARTGAEAKLVDRIESGADLEFLPRPDVTGRASELSGELSIRVRSLQFSPQSADPSAPTPLLFRTDQKQSTQLVSGRAVVLIHINGANSPDEAAVAIVTLLRADLVQ